MQPLEFGPHPARTARLPGFFGRSGWPVLLAAAACAVAGALVPAGGAAPRGVAAQNTTPQPHVVTITVEGLLPAVIAVPAGSIVTWVNTTEQVHNTTHVPDFGQPVTWTSGDITANGGQYRHTFESLGTYNYIDVLFPDDVGYQGTVIVTANDPTATPLVPTIGPTPTDGPTPTPRPATATAPPTPTAPEPTRVPVVLEGRLVSASVPACRVDAAVRPCDNPASLVFVRGDGAIDPRLIGRDVHLEGAMVDCDEAGISYVWLSQVSELPGGCNRPTDTPSPTPTASPESPMGVNFALGRPVTAKDPALPGYEPDRATDGKADTVWYSDYQVSWAYVDLGESRTFNRVRLRWSAPYAQRYGIYVWEEGAWRGKLVVDNAHGGEDVRTFTFTDARYVMLYLMRSSAPDGGYALGEWEVYGEARPNWALGQPVVASSDQAGQVGAYATDGLMGTFWVSAPGDANPWLAVYLPASVEMTEFRLWWTTAYPSYYSLVFFEGGRRTLFSPVQLDHGGLHRLVGRVPVRADTVMIYTQRNSPVGYVALQEVEILGPGPGDDADSAWMDAHGVDAWLTFGRLAAAELPLGSASLGPAPKAVGPLPGNESTR